MEYSFINKKMIFSILMLFVFIFAIQMVDPVNAATKTKLIDKGSKTFSFSDGQSVKYTWKTYITGKKITIKANSKFSDGSNYPEVYTLSKISKTKLKITEFVQKQYSAYYIKTKLSAKQYYWKAYRSGSILSGYEFRYL